MASDRDFESGPVHGGEEEEWSGPWGRGPWGRGPRGPRGRWGRGPWGPDFGPGFGAGFGHGHHRGFGPFGHFGPEQQPEREVFARVGFDVMRLVRAGLLASGGDSARLTQLRAILERTRDELNAFLGQPSSGGASGQSGQGGQGYTPTNDMPSSVI